MPFEERCDDTGVLFGLDGAGAVDDRTTGLHKTGGVFQQSFLDRSQLADVADVTFPLHVRFLRQRAETGTGRIQQDAVGERTFKRGCIGSAEIDDLHSQTFGGSTDELELRFVFVQRYDLSRVAP